ncbi:hypothetical protein SAMN05421781_0509 [Marinococcus luteus]|uniref:Uncharacterized protein n=1 Tax=Marinococcus luteus TaxID=1122204 RepID=A0A1H2QZ81_9BACI|nr:hypothetical protein [Marinococcus luteus]SDW11944.1 hypothetical protein SAMN05421781_0509 [Marinococcus luteus]
MFEKTMNWSFAIMALMISVMNGFLGVGLAWLVNLIPQAEFSIWWGMVLAAPILLIAIVQQVVFRKAQKDFDSFFDRK